MPVSLVKLTKATPRGGKHFANHVHASSMLYKGKHRTSVGHMSTFQHRLLVRFYADVVAA